MAERYLKKYIPLRPSLSGVCLTCSMGITHAFYFFSEVLKSGDCRSQFTLFKLADMQSFPCGKSLRLNISLRKVLTFKFLPNRLLLRFLCQKQLEDELVVEAIPDCIPVVTKGGMLCPLK